MINVYRVSDTQNYLVFDQDGTNYTMSYYKDGHRMKCIDE